MAKPRKQRLTRRESPEKPPYWKPLNDAVKLRESSAYKLHKEVKRLTGGARGSSEAAIRDYLDGEVKHLRPDILNALATTLTVNPKWLAGGAAPREAVHEPGDLELTMAFGWSELPGWTGRLADALEAIGWQVPNVTHEMKASFVQTVWELVESAPDHKPSLPETLPDEIAWDLGWLITLPLRGWGMRRTFQGRWLRDYIMASLHAVRLGIEDDPQKGSPVSDYEGSLLPTLRRSGPGRLFPARRRK